MSVVPLEPQPLFFRPGSQGQRAGAKDAKEAKSLGSAKRRRRKAQELMQRGESTTSEPATPLQRLTSSRYFEWFSGVLICSNAVFIGLQTQDSALQAEADAALGRTLQVHTPTGFLTLHVLFSVLFSFELVMRWVCEGLVDFFRERDRWWNLLDVVIVAASWIDLFMQVVSQIEDGDHTGIRSLAILRVVRVVRVVRIARVIRIMRFFRELRMMVYSILGSMKYLLWVILVLVMTFYVFGVTFTAATISQLDTADLWLSPDTRDLRQNFGTVDRSILSLFMAMSGGNDWGMYYDALRTLPWQYQFLFLLFITFAVFAVVNIVTGVFVDSAMQSNFVDREIIVHEELEAKKSYLSSMRQVFEEMDADSTGCISLEEFERRLNDERVIAYFNALKLDVSDARTLFRLLDYDQSNEVNIDEFLTGCYRLQGESRSLDMKIMQCEVRFLQESFLVFGNTLHDIHSYMIGLNSKKIRARTREAVMEHCSSRRSAGTSESDSADDGHV